MTEQQQKRNVLVVEDDHDTNEMISDILSRAGYAPLAAFNGETGVKIAKTEKPDLILLDLMLPDIDGLEVCRQLAGNENTRSIPIIVLTCKKELSTKLSSFVAGAKRFLTKPFDDKELLNEISRTLRQKNMQAHDGSNFIEPRD